ncbi:ligase-associated DNA damage response exonuclease [Alteriqipengyuania flavescens]|uniref:ligase-associated DNA damage response exonuclease n=1 Tax=Alteriqipengyuania flavescens TaxID=3053610 RepID=UPI0025B5664C|nr:ligase-associated DNA damage response exonuclease [Alteriqipengyuania flavescens]WJY19565.1 ligase-associated DNA damage response exonuclease [Alteriqipengyuania flavescens]WJY25505.1 ligase-associated DNA damage response exonuclease [Alteriqipengyuania flavescens]
MAAPFSWIRPEPWGIHVVPADTWIDPSKAVPHALVTHGHADHARGGHGETVATPETLAIMELRYRTGAQDDAGEIPHRAVPIEYGETIRLKGGVDATYIPAGHVLGSAQILLEHAGERVICTGDYKRRADPTCPPFEVTPCDILITEATFGLPLFTHPPVEQEIGKILTALKENPDRCVLVGAYALGKAQRVIAELRAAGHDRTIYLHGAMERMCRLYEDHGVALGDLKLVSDADKDAMRGHVIVCPPSALNDRWSRRLPDPVTAMASGWMMVRQRARQRNVELPLVISDHADWNELTRTIQEVDPVESWITHGREEALLRWHQLHQRRARALALVGYDDEDD